jgi:hypothetical protein
MTTKSKTKAIVARTQEIVYSPPALMLPDVMRRQLEVESRKRAILTEFITKHMLKGVDYGQITIKSKRTGREYTSKPTLFKPGAEKFCSLFRLRAEYKKDAETWEMLGSKPGTVCYICYIYSGDVLVGEGRGSCSVAEKDGIENSAVKIAKKRAKLDAVLETGGLSEFFSQDLEDLGVQNSIRKGLDGAGKKRTAKTSVIEEAKAMIATAKTTEYLFAILERVQQSDKFNAKEKQDLEHLISTRVDTLDNEKATQ